MAAMPASAVQIEELALSADWISVSVAIVTAVISLIFSLLSYLQARAALRRADHALVLERSSSAVAHYLAVISESEKLYADVRKAVDGLYELADSSNFDREKLKSYIVNVGPDFVDKFQALLSANADLLEPQMQQFLVRQVFEGFFPLAEALTESRDDQVSNLTEWSQPLREVALNVNRYTGCLRAKLFERRSRLVALSPLADAGSS